MMSGGVIEPPCLDPQTPLDKLKDIAKSLALGTDTIMKINSD